MVARGLDIKKAPEGNMQTDFARLLYRSKRFLCGLICIIGIKAEFVKENWKKCNFSIDKASEMGYIVSVFVRLASHAGRPPLNEAALWPHSTEPGI